MTDMRTYFTAALAASAVLALAAQGQTPPAPQEPPRQPSEIDVKIGGPPGLPPKLAVPDFIQEMKRRVHSDAKIRKVVYDNPLEFFSQCKRFKFSAAK